MHSWNFIFQWGYVKNDSAPPALPDLPITSERRIFLAFLASSPLSTPFIGSLCTAVTHTKTCWKASIPTSLLDFLPVRLLDSLLVELNYYLVGSVFYHSRSGIYALLQYFLHELAAAIISIYHPASWKKCRLCCLTRLLGQHGARASSMGTFFSMA